MMELVDLSCGYGGVPVLQHINLTLEPGKLYGIIGPNGSGKSTLVRTAAGIQKRLAGSILLQEKDLEEYDRRTLAQMVSYMPQSRPVPNISAGKMVLHGRFPYLGYPRRYRKEDVTLAREALERADASDLSDKMLPQLSGGQQQRVYLAMLLCQDTDVVFLDEPTTYLDVEHQFSLMDLARDMTEGGKTVVVVLHDLCMAMSYADEVCLLNQGTISAVGTPEEIYASRKVDEVFHIPFRRMETEDGIKYYYESAGSK